MYRNIVPWLVLYREINLHTRQGMRGQLLGHCLATVVLLSGKAGREGRQGGVEGGGGRDGGVFCTSRCCCVD
jgi:hypothetical protein